MRVLLIALVAVTSLSLFATEPNPSKRQRELIEEFLELTNAESTQRSAIDAMFGQIEKQMVETAAADDDPARVEEAKALFAAFREHVSRIDLKGPMQEATIRSYARNFNEAELADIVAFYRTPTGRKSVEVLPELMREQMDAGATYLGPKIDQAMRNAMEDREKARPWIRTMSDIRTVATAVEAYATDYDRYPNADYTGLKAILEPIYLTKLPEKDVWDHAYAYVVSPDGQQYRFVSPGADGIFEWDSRRTAAPSPESIPIDYRESLADDIVFSDGVFIRQPVQAKVEDVH